MEHGIPEDCADRLKASIAKCTTYPAAPKTLYSVFKFFRVLLKGPFQIYSKIRGDICKSRCINGINDTGGKFAIGINNTSRKFCHQFHSVVDTGGKFATGVKTPVANNGNNIRLRRP